jgi:hypothetical protein
LLQKLQSEREIANPLCNTIPRWLIEAPSIHAGVSQKSHRRLAVESIDRE